ncbi:MAG TPA: glycosyltransferase family 4 protein [Gammaproteobacteria bacterium]|nr:glycosyltransferase family 4 protein [Gammaproteobacteria bacterium]
MRPKLLYLVTEDWYFCSHRLPIARAARDAGFEVVVVTRVRAHMEQLRDERFRVIPLEFRRGRFAPLSDLGVLRKLVQCYRRERPDLVHHVALKPVIYGSLASRYAGVTNVVNALGGLGYVFTSRSAKARLLRPLVRGGLRRLLGARGSWLVVQNPDDYQQLVERAGAVAERSLIIRGSGVDVRYFRPWGEPSGPVVVASMVGRMLWDKGVGDLVEAARLLKERGCAVRVVLVGPPDPENPASIPVAQITEWVRHGWVEWCGQRTDIGEVWRQSHLAILPSYREGLPKALLEAAACGRPIVTTDTPGCREIVRDGENGILVPPRDPGALAEAIERLAGDPALRARMGACGRRMVEAEFSEEHVVEQTLGLYRSVLGGYWPS